MRGWKEDKGWTMKTKSWLDEDKSLIWWANTRHKLDKDICIQAMYLGQSLDIGQSLDKLLRTYIGKQHQIFARILSLLKGAISSNSVLANSCLAEYGLANSWIWFSWFWSNRKWFTRFLLTGLGDSCFESIKVPPPSQIHSGESERGGCVARQMSLLPMLECIFLTWRSRHYSKTISWQSENFNNNNKIVHQCSSIPNSCWGWVQTMKVWLQVGIKSYTVLKVGGLSNSSLAE